MKLKALVFLLISTAILSAAYLTDIEVTLTQPDGSTIECLTSGDEYFNWLHDSEGYTIIQSQDDGYYYYAISENGKLHPSTLRVDTDSALKYRLEVEARISPEEYKRRREVLHPSPERSSRAPSEGLINNIVIFIKCNDQSEFYTDRSVFDAKFNDDSGNNDSMVDYYNEVSYGVLEIESHTYPICDMDDNLSYTTPYDRGYFSPYNSYTNPNGYTSENQGMSRLQSMLADAVSYIESEVEDSLDIDGDSDGRVDNVCFVFRGNSDGWADVVWAHRFYLSQQAAYINGKRVWDYTFQPENQNDVNTLCHEMFHALGAPDLYHYSYDGFTPVGPWDIMAEGFPHMGAFMKYQYGHWIDEIPEITESGTYSLQPLQSPTNNCYKIASPNSTQEYFVLEYRKRISGTYDMDVPGSGLVIYRVNPFVDDGNMNGPPDHLYAYRPNGTLSNNGNVDAAFFSAETGRTEFSGTTNPSCFLGDGSDGGIHIYQVGTAGDSISFVFNPGMGYISGTVVLDEVIDDAQVQDVEITYGSETIYPSASGDFVCFLYEGSYDFTFSLDGYFQSTYEDLIIEDGGFADLGIITMQPATAPENLTYEINNSQVTMTWDFSAYDHEDFEHFKVYLSLNGGNSFSSIGNPNEASYTMNINPDFTYMYQVKAVYDNIISLPSNTITVFFTPIGEDITSTPLTSKIVGNTPNPFVISGNSRNSGTTISYSLATPGNIEISIYNVKGQKVKTLTDDKKTIGNHSIKWDGSDSSNKNVQSGVYYYVLEHNNKKIDTNKMIILQ